MFREDFKKGNTYEKKFAQWLADEHGYTKLFFNNDGDYDIKAVKESPDGVMAITFEVKTDFYPQQTGNLAIEFFCLRKHKLTGIFETKANLFVYIFPDDTTYVFHPLILKKYLTENNIKVTRGGDNNMAVMFLLTRQEAKQIAKQIISGII